MPSGGTGSGTSSDNGCARRIAGTFGIPVSELQ